MKEKFYFIAKSFLFLGEMNNCGSLLLFGWENFSLFLVNLKCHKFGINVQNRGGNMDKHC